MKTCSKCKKTLPLVRFKKDKNRKDGLSSWCKKCHSDDVVKYQKRNKQATDRNKKRHQIKSYGITDKDYYKIYDKQHGECLICEQKFDVLCIDHCHSTGEIRGLICSKCNSGIGFLKDNAYLAAKAFVYLFKHTSCRVGKMAGAGFIMGFFRQKLEFDKVNETSKISEGVYNHMQDLDKVKVKGR